MPLSIRMIDSPMLGFLASRLYGLRTVEKLLHDAVFDLTNITPDVVQEYYRPASDPEGRRAVRLSLQYFEDEEIIANLRTLTADTLILMGAEDKWHSAESCELYHAALRNAGFAVVRQRRPPDARRKAGQVCCGNAGIHSRCDAVTALDTLKRTFGARRMARLFLSGPFASQATLCASPVCCKDR